MSKVNISNPYGTEPSVFTSEFTDYKERLSKALNWYSYEKEKKDARAYLRSFLQHVNKPAVKMFDSVPDYEIKNTYGWLARMVSNGTILNSQDRSKLDDYMLYLLSRQLETPSEPVIEKAPRPSVRENMEEKVREYLGELEGAIDNLILNGEELDLFIDLKSRSIPPLYSTYIESFIKKKVSEYIFVYETTDKEYKEAYENLGKRKLTQLIKMLNSWTESLERYAQFKKANRKPRARKTKSPVQQVAKLKYKREDETLNIKSVIPSEVVGASQVWIYNCKYKRLAVYRSDSTQGIQVKGTTLQNYDPDMCEQRSIRRPEIVLPRLLEAGKVQLRKFLSDLATTEYSVTGRINEDCLIVRVIK